MCQAPSGRDVAASARQFLRLPVVGPFESEQTRDRVFTAMNTRLGPQQAAWMIELVEAEPDAPSEAAAVG